MADMRLGDTSMQSVSLRLSDLSIVESQLSQTEDQSQTRSSAFSTLRHSLHAVAGETHLPFISAQTSTRSSTIHDYQSLQQDEHDIPSSSHRHKTVSDSSVPLRTISMADSSITENSLSGINPNGLPECSVDQIHRAIDEMSFESLQIFVRNQAFQIHQFQRKSEPEQDEKPTLQSRLSTVTTMMGWVFKKSTLLHKWIRRYACLKGSTLNFLDSPQSSVKNQINLEYCLVDLVRRGSKDAVRLRHEGTVTLLRAEPPDNNRDWIMAIGSQVSLLSYLHKLRMINLPPDPRIIRYFQKSFANHLILDGHPIHVEALVALRIPFANTCFLQSLSISRAFVDDLCVDALCEGLQTNESLSILKLDENEISDDGMITLAKVLSHRSNLVSVSLRRNRIKDNGFLSLLESCTNNLSLSELDLSGNKISDQGLRMAFELLCSRDCILRLTKLVVSENKIGNEGLKWLLKILSSNHSRITDLDLTSTNIDDVGAAILADFLPSSKIVNLTVNNNKISRVGACQLIRAFKIKIHVTFTSISTPFCVSSPSLKLLFL
eukprot:TRINITY_DN1748_c0_g1_i2.p1 TRINITY_DN1748_c0_g1~~TRINITY_DN1748_c0_g1_i2.p1  ORF type:complete len:549 (+),score=66.10 TRINITY_DN1748_c0_g1_i2:102-1748(+)